MTCDKVGIPSMLILNKHNRFIGINAYQGMPLLLLGLYCFFLLIKVWLLVFRTLRIWEHQPGLGNNCGVPRRPARRSKSQDPGLALRRYVSKTSFIKNMPKPLASWNWHDKYLSIIESAISSRCHLKPYSEKPIQARQSKMSRLFASMKKAVDKLHFRGHRYSGWPNLSLAWSQLGFWQPSFCRKHNLWSLCFDGVNWVMLHSIAFLEERECVEKLGMM